MTPLEYFGLDQASGSLGPTLELQFPRAIHGAFGGVTGGALGAAAVALGRTVADEGRRAIGLDIHFLRGLASETATATVELLSQGRSLTFARVEFTDDKGKRTTVARVAYAAPAALEPIDVEVAPTYLGPPPEDLAATSKPWRSPKGVEVPIIDTAQPRAAKVGDAIATLVTVPWQVTGDGAEAACLAADLSVGPPVDAVLPRGTWVPHPNPDVSLRFAGQITSADLTAIATCRRVDRGVATVESEVWDRAELVATAVSTSLFLATN